MDEKTTESPVRLALLGAGTFAKSAHFSVLSALKANGRVSIELIWSRHKESADALASQYVGNITVEYADIDTPAVESARLALETHRHRIDAVILCVPIPQNAEFTQLALSLNLHVLCEKPLAHDIPSALALLDYSASRSQTPVFHGVAENFRFEEVFRYARRMQAEVCGDVVAIRLTAQTPMVPGSRYAFGWRLQLPDAGILQDGFVHHIAAMRILADADVASVFATCFSKGGHFKGCDTAVANLMFENDLSASVFVTFACAVFQWEIVVTGTCGDVVVKRVTGKPGYRVISRDTEKVLEDHWFPFSGLEAELDAFVSSCHTGVLHECLDARAAFNDMATVHSMFKSSVDGCAVDVPKPNPHCRPT